MKKIIISAWLLVFCAITFSQNVEGVWKTTMETQNGPYTFYANYTVNGDTISGKLYSIDGSVKIFNGKINGNQFEYNFNLDVYQIKHEGRLEDGELKIKSISENGESEFIMTREEEQ